MSEPFKLEPVGWRVRVARMLEFRPRELATLAILVVLIVGGATFAFLRTLPHAQALPPDSGPTALATGSSSPLPGPTLSPSGGPIYVHVAGAVFHPGVYPFPPGARVADALKAAGGATRDADANAINLARPLTDGERIYVPRRGEQPPAEASTGSGTNAGSGSGSGGKLNINTASEKELEDLPGIGPALAQRIVEYRTQHGPFRAIRDLMKVPGIGEKKYDALKEHITV